MTDEQQRIAIAEACGVLPEMTDICPDCGGLTPYEAGDDYGLTIWEKCNRCNNTGRVNLYYAGKIPDYLNDLNAMREAEKHLPDLNLYRRFLYLEVLEDPTNQSNEPAFATARQRADAFLRTRGLL